MMPVIEQYFLPLFLTTFIECFIYILSIKKNVRSLLLYSVLINFFTQPFASYIYQDIFKNFFLLEGAIILLESVLLMQLLQIKYTKALLVSFFANLISAIFSFAF